MNDILGTDGVALIAALAARRTLVGLDFDGTLAPIVRERGRANMRASTAELLRRLCLSWPVAVVSGRARADVADRLGDARVTAVVGNHGLEPAAGTPAAPALAAALAPLGALAGVEVEDKRFSAAVHYRRAPDARAARRAIDAHIRALTVPVRIIGGKRLVNVLPADGADKGDAIAALLATSACDHVLYAGDDVTDEAVFVRARHDPARWFGVRVGRARGSAALWSLPSQPAIDRLLAALVAARPEPAGAASLR